MERSRILEVGSRWHRLVATSYLEMQLAICIARFQLATKIAIAAARPAGVRGLPGRGNLGPIRVGRAVLGSIRHICRPDSKPFPRASPEGKNRYVLLDQKFTKLKFGSSRAAFKIGNSIIRSTQGVQVVFC